MAEIKYVKQSGAAEAGGNFYEMKLAMLFLLRGTIAFRNHQLDSFRLAANLDVAHPFDDIVFKRTHQGRSEIVLLQAKYRKNPAKSAIVWDTLMSSNKDFSVKKYLEGAMDMDMDQELEGPFDRTDFVLYTNAPLKKDERMMEAEASSIYRADGKSVAKVCFNDDVYQKLKLNSDFTTLVEEFVRSIQSGEFKPELPIYQKYRSCLQNVITLNDIGGVDLDFLSSDLRDLKEAVSKKLGSDLLVTKMKIKKGYKGSQGVKAKKAIVKYATQGEVRDFLDNFYIACDQPGEADLEDLIKKEIASAYRIDQNDAEIIFRDVYAKIQSWWKDDNYYLTEKHEWFEVARRNISEPSLIYAADLMKMKLKNTGIEYRMIEGSESCCKSSKLVNIVCDKSVGILNCAQVYQVMEKQLEKMFYLFLDQKSFGNMKNKVLEVFRRTCDVLVVHSYELVPDELVRIVEESENKRIIWIGSVQSEFTSMALKIGFKDLTDKSRADILNNSQILLQGDEVSLKDLVGLNVDDAISDDLLANLVSDGISEFSKPMEGLGKVSPFYITRTLQRTGYTKDFEPQEIGPDDGNLFVLISAPPGMGKSTMISSMNNKAFRWKYRINLREHSAILKTGKQDDALEFLKEATAMSQTEYKLFKTSYEVCGKIALFFDGFDEIAPNYKNTALKLFASLRKSKVNEAWVTTRPGFEKDLEKELNTVVYNIQPFSEDEQKEFLKKIWKTSDSSVVNEHLKKFSRAVRDSVNFAGIPLHLKMISEMRGESIFNEELNLFSVYEKFFFTKFYDVAMSDKANMDLNNPLVKSVVDERYATIRRKHEMLSIKTLFDESDLSNMVSLDEVNRFEDDRTGVVYSANWKPAFVHRTFAEFFAASWLASFYIEHKVSKDFSKIRIYKNMFYPENSQLRLFFDFALCDGSEACRAVLNRDLNKLTNMSLASLSKKDAAGRTAFHLAEAYDYPDVYDVLIQKSADNYVADQLFSFNPAQYKYFKFFSFWDDIQKYMELNREAENGHIDDNMITPLHLAASNGHVETIMRLIQNGARLNAEDHTGMTPLIVAIVFEKYHAAKVLMENRADVNASDSYGFTPLHHVAIIGENDVTRMLLDHGANPNVQSKNHWTPLYVAALIGNGEVAQILIKRGANPNWKASDGSTALHVAAQNGLHALVQKMMEHGAYSNAKADNGRTPLHLAALCGHREVALELFLVGSNLDAQALMERGADPNAKEEEGTTPLHVAAQNGHAHVALVLIFNGADVNSVRRNGWTPLHFAAQNNRVEVARILIYRGANVNSKGTDGWAPLHLAAQFNHIEFVKILMEHGAEPSSEGETGWTPLHFAANFDNTEVMRALIKGGADPDATGGNGWTALHLAAESNSSEAVRVLISSGANRNAKGEHDRTPLHVAALVGHCEIVHTLIEHGADHQSKDHSGLTALDVAIKIGHLEVQNILKTHDYCSDAKNCDII